MVNSRARQLVTSLTAKGRSERAARRPPVNSLPLWETSGKAPSASSPSVIAFPAADVLAETISGPADQAQHCQSNKICDHLLLLSLMNCPAASRLNPHLIACSGAASLMLLL